MLKHNDKTLGIGRVDLSNYATKLETENALALKADTSALATTNASVGALLALLTAGDETFKFGGLKTEAEYNALSSEEQNSAIYFLYEV